MSGLARATRGRGSAALPTGSRGGWKPPPLILLFSLRPFALRAGAGPAPTHSAWPRDLLKILPQFPLLVLTTLSVMGILCQRRTPGALGCMVATCNADSGSNAPELANRPSAVSVRWPEGGVLHGGQASRLLRWSARPGWLCQSTAPGQANAAVCSSAELGARLQPVVSPQREDTSCGALSRDRAGALLSHRSTEPAGRTSQPLQRPREVR